MLASSARARSGHWWSAASRASLGSPRSGLDRAGCVRLTGPACRLHRGAGQERTPQEPARDSKIGHARKCIQHFERGSRQGSFRQRRGRSQFVTPVIQAQGRRPAWRSARARARRRGGRRRAQRTGRAPRLRDDRWVVARVSAPPSEPPHRTLPCGPRTRPNSSALRPAQRSDGSRPCPIARVAAETTAAPAVSASKPMNSSVMPRASGSRRSTAPDSSIDRCRSSHAAYSAAQRANAAVSACRPRQSLRVGCGRRACAP